MATPSPISNPPAATPPMMAQPPAPSDSATAPVISESDAQSGKPGATTKTLDLPGGGSLTISGDALVYREGLKQAQKRGRANLCGVGGAQPQSKTIPLYNILYASTENESSQLHIDYADQTSATSITVATLRIPYTTFTDAPPPSSTNTAATDPPTVQSFIATLLALSYGPSKPRKKAYVLINPHAGPGGARKIWTKDVLPIFTAARMSLTVVETKHSGEAVTLVRDLPDLYDYDTIIPCSGDGLPHEVFNGLAQRPDASKALSSVPVSHIPCGSGNAMSCNLYGTHRPSLAALAIVKGVVTPLDLVSITQGDRRLISFLSQALGIVAESDLATEHLRWMGEQRFTYGFLKRIFARRTYPCDLAVKVAVEDKEGVRAHYRRGRSVEAGLDKLATGGANGDASGGSRSAGEGSSNVSLMGTATGAAGHYESDSTAATTPALESSEDGDGQGLPRLRYGTVQDELPEGWEMVRHDKMGNFYCGNMAYMAPAANFFSAALASDGYLDLVTSRGDISPISSVKLLLSVESNHFFDNPLVSYKKIEAFRIIPRDTKNAGEGYISIDGERVPFEPFQAEVHKGLGRVISKKGGFEAPGPKDWDVVGVGERLRA